MSRARALYPNPKTKPLAIYIDDALREQLAWMAQQEHTSMSQYAVKLIRQAAKDTKAPKPRKSNPWWPSPADAPAK